MTDQIRRASRSVCSNIAEGWRKRRYVASFKNRFTDADGEAAETQSWLDSAIDCRYITRDEHKDLDAQYDHISAQLRLMIADAERWCAHETQSQKHRESPGF
jgi:four helix bundle protein